MDFHTQGRYLIVGLRVQSSGLTYTEPSPTGEEGEDNEKKTEQIQKKGTKAIPKCDRKTGRLDQLANCTCIKRNSIFFCFPKKEKAKVYEVKIFHNVGRSPRFEILA